MKIEKVIIGIETHVQLNTKTKMFCSCSTNYKGALPNTNVCPVCLGYPGILPKPNRKAFMEAIKVGFVLNSDIQQKSRFDRKNYMYPDLFKGYQITQFEYPINLGGYVDISNKRIEITRAHLEEDTAKSIHEKENTLIDGNKAGIPLLEIVSEPQMNTSDEAVEYVRRLRNLIRFIKSSSCDMEKGEMRFDINVNLGIIDNGTEYRTPICEVKNLNSFKSLKGAIEYEIKRQEEEFKKTKIQLDKGNKTTRGWNDNLQKTYFLRVKEESDDYRYFPEPDIPPFNLDKEFIENTINNIKDNPYEAIKKMEKDNISHDLIGLIFEDLKAYKFYSKSAIKYKGEKMNIANWIVNDIFSLNNEYGIDINDINIEDFVQLLENIDNKTINVTSAKDIFRRIVLKSEDIKKLIEENSILHDDSAIDNVIKKVLSQNKDLVEKYISGKDGLLGFFVGKVLLEVKGRYDPQDIREKIIDFIKSSFN